MVGLPSRCPEKEKPSNSASERHAYLLSQLVDEQEGSARAVRDAGQLAERLVAARPKSTKTKELSALKAAGGRPLDRAVPIHPEYSEPLQQSALNVSTIFQSFRHPLPIAPAY